MTQNRKLGPLPVWPYFFLAPICAIAGLIFVVFWWPSGYPDKSQLTEISGDIERVAIRDEISKTTAGAILPGITSVYFKLKGVPGEFRYPSAHPRFFKVRDYTAVAIDILVNREDLGKNEAALIWQIKERNPQDDEAELTNISYDEVMERLTSADWTVVKLGFWCLAAAAGLLLLGGLVRRWNRGRAAD